MKSKVPVVCLVGYSDTGKTTLVEKLVGELKERGYRVGTIKHTHHPPEHPRHKDTGRHSQAGAEVTVLAAPGELLLIKKVEEEPGPGQIAGMMPGVDIVLAEGFKGSREPKVLVCGSDDRPLPPVAPEELVAVVGATEGFAGVPCFSPDQAVELADLLVSLFLSRETGVAGEVGPEILEAVRQAAQDGRITCGAARRLAQELKVPLGLVGQAADELGIKIKECGLGCF